MAAVTVAAVGAAASIGSAVASGRKARKERKAANSMERKIEQLEANRQAVIDPSESITDLSGSLSNPYANLGVSTKAAEFQSEQADQSLANILDTMKASGGGGAGSATALAKSALESKQGIAADIAKQEQENQKLRAGGEAELQKSIMSEKQRVQQAKAEGQIFKFQAQESRDISKLNRLAGKQQQHMANQAAANQATWSAIGNIGGQMMSGGISKMK